MANPEHVAKLQEGVQAWNAWRAQNPDILPDLRVANLTRRDLRGVNLDRADLAGANLGEVNLIGADLSRADLSRADLAGANLSGVNLYGVGLRRAGLSRADLSRADLGEANLREADLGGANLGGANLRGADLSGANLAGVNFAGVSLYDTIFANVDLRRVKGLDSCLHYGPSMIDHRTFERSGMLPTPFLRGCGLPDTLIDYLPSLLNQPIQHYSCFISYASKNDDFAQRLYADLQNKGVRCWFAPEDMKIGDKILDTIDEAIRLRDKVLLILSRHAIGSEWVEDEVTKAYAEERRRRQTILFPIRIDEAVMETGEPWAVKLKNSRHIGDFYNWKNHDDYQKGLERLLRDLKIEKGK